MDWQLQWWFSRAEVGNTQGVSDAGACGMCARINEILTQPLNHPQNSINYGVSHHTLHVVAIAFGRPHCCCKWGPARPSLQEEEEEAATEKVQRHCCSHWQQQQQLRQGNQTKQGN